MSGLDEYLCPITVEGKPLEDSLKTYKVDYTIRDQTSLCSEVFHIF